MIKEKLKNWLFPVKRMVVAEVKDKERIFTTDFIEDRYLRQIHISTILENMMAKLPVPTAPEGTAMDAATPSRFGPNFSAYNNLPDALFSWYVSQTFIGYQACALMAQQWLIGKCCLMPAQDAVRNGYEVTVNDGTEIDPKVRDAIRDADVRYNLNHNLVELIQMGRIFGIRIAMFKVDSDDPDYYKKPFNPDGVKPGSYKGIAQLDPYWITPQLDDAAAGDPSSIYFYEPTWWRVSGELIHRSHLVIYRTEEVADILKPTYIYGGIPIPQKIYERVYGAERTANEAPMLTMTKRLDVLKTDMANAIANQSNFEARMRQYAYNRDNFGIKTIDENEEMQRFDTTLADLDAVIMTQYQLVAAAANVPSVKLLGTSPKGFNATGEFEESNYHEFLETVQEIGMTPLINRHHLLLIRSEIAPQFGIAPFETCVSWNELDAMTAEEQAVVNKTKADTGLVLVQAGAIDGMDERKRVINDPDSGYSGLVDEDDPVESNEIEESTEQNYNA